MPHVEASVTSTNEIIIIIIIIYNTCTTRAHGSFHLVGSTLATKPILL